MPILVNCFSDIMMIIMLLNLSSITGCSLGSSEDCSGYFGYLLQEWRLEVCSLSFSCAGFFVLATNFFSLFSSRATTGHARGWCSAGIQGLLVKWRRWWCRREQRQTSGSITVPGTTRCSFLKYTSVHLPFYLWLIVCTLFSFCIIFRMYLIKQ